jgi:hypothetical protein
MVIRTAIAVFGFLLFVSGCSQSYQMLPAGSGATLLKGSQVVFVASVASGGISVEKMLLEESVLPGSMLATSPTFHVTFAVERPLKGHRHSPLLPISDLSVNDHDLLGTPPRIAPALAPRLYPNFHYWVGYQFDFLGHLCGLTFMPAGDEPASIMQALRSWAQRNGSGSLRARLWKWH